MLFHGFYILSTQPLIVSFIGTYPFLGGLLYQGQKLTYQPLPKWFRPKHVLEHLPGWAGTWSQMSRRKVKEILHTFEGRTHHLMVNASDEEELRKRFSVRGAHFNHNIYVNEHLYQPHNEPKIYDAIYTARLTPFKRHWLAKNVERLMVVSYGGDLHAFCPELKHAEFNKEFISRPELARKYNQSYAGLCLSAREGAMFASCEYLLSGIPIVSTPSKGGRDEFFTMQNSLIVPPQPEAVAQAVQNWKQLKPIPQEIREQTLKQINHLRLGYCTYISQLISQESGDCKKPEELMEKYFAPPDGIHSRFLKLENLWTSQIEDLEKAFSL